MKLISWWHTVVRAALEKKIKGEEEAETPDHLPEVCRWLWECERITYAPASPKFSPFGDFLKAWICILFTRKRNSRVLGLGIKRGPAEGQIQKCSVPRGRAKEVVLNQIFLWMESPPPRETTVCFQRNRVIEINQSCFLFPFKGALCWPLATFTRHVLKCKVDTFDCDNWYKGLGFSRNSENHSDCLFHELKNIKHNAQAGFDVIRK